VLLVSRRKENGPDHRPVQGVSVSGALSSTSIDSSLESKELSLAINEVDTTCDVSIAFEARADYGLAKNEADEVIEQTTTGSCIVEERSDPALDSESRARSHGVSVRALTNPQTTARSLDLYARHAVSDRPSASRQTFDIPSRRQDHQRKVRQALHFSWINLSLRLPRRKPLAGSICL